MIRFFIQRILAAIPTLFGISLATFVVMNLALTSAVSSSVGPWAERSATLVTGAFDRNVFNDNHLPLFVNLDIQDAEDYARRAIADLAVDAKAPQAHRTLVSAGGAWLPYTIPVLSDLPPLTRSRLLDALDEVAARTGATRTLRLAPDRASFWLRYWEIYGSDFQPVRALRLVRRLTRRVDTLALAELRSLDTFCLPQILEVLDEPLPPIAQARLVGLLGELTGISDPLDHSASEASREAVLLRWREWWGYRYSRFTVFEGLSRITGTIVETRYFRWMSRIVRMDFGISTRDGRPISRKLQERLPITLLLSGLALLLAYCVAIPVGIVSAIRRGGLFDRVTGVVLIVLYSFPVFWMAMLLITYLGGFGHLDIFPASGVSSPGSEDWSTWARFRDTAHHLVLPVFCLSFVSMAMLARYQRIGTLQVINKDFMRMARAKGFSETGAMLKHGLRSSVIPVITMLGLQIPYLVSGSVVVERIFGIPGMGLETFEAIRAHDKPWLMAVITVTAIMTMLGVVLADVVYAILDPRIAPGSRRGGRQ